MKKITFYFLLILILLNGCTQNIVLHQPKSEIEQIDLVYSPRGEHEVLLTLTGTQIEPFLEALLELDLHKSSHPQDIGGSLIVEIKYYNGAIDLLGTWSVGYMVGDTLEHDGWFSISDDDLYNLFSKYLDLSSLPYL